jgi:RNA polymerase sigma factor (sigma-70 family)
MADGRGMTMATGFGAELDALTLARARRGDGQAFEAIYRRYAKPAYTLALRLTARPDVADDVVQEAFMKAMEKLGGFRGDAPFGAWLKRLVANCAIDRLRADRRWVDGDAETLLLSAESCAEAQIEALGLLARMSAQARTALVLHEIEGYNHAELAQMFGKSESYSKSLLSRAISRLRGLLDAESDTMSLQVIPQ